LIRAAAVLIRAAAVLIRAAGVLTSAAGVLTSKSMWEVTLRARPATLTAGQPSRTGRTIPV